MPLPVSSQDIVNEILGWLPLASASDPTLLRHSCAAALVCKAWLAPARRNIFRVLDLVIGHGWTSSLDARLPRLLHILESSEDLAGSIHEIIWSSPYETFDHRSEFPGDSLEQLAVLTKECNITHTFDTSLLNRDNAQEMMRILDRMKPELVDSVQHLRLGMSLDQTEDMISLLRRLTKLKCLDISYLTPLNPYSSFFRDGLSKGHLTYLNFETNVGFDSPHDLCSFLASFPRLNDLTLGQVSLWERSVMTAHLRSSGSPPPLKRLRMREVMSEDTTVGNTVIQWLQLCAKVATIEEFDMECELDSIGAAITVCHDTLRTLDILVSKNTRVDLSLCISMRNVLLHLPSPGAFESVIPILASISSDILETVLIRFGYDPGPDASWDELRSVLYRPQFTNVRELHLHFNAVQWLAEYRVRQNLAIPFGYRSLYVSWSW